MGHPPRARKDAANLLVRRFTAEIPPVARPLEASTLLDQGDAEEQFRLGQNFYSTQDYGQAAVWLSKAAEQGHGKAQSHLGYLYCKGHGVPQDDAQAVVLWQRAAEQGDETALFDLVLLYASEAMGIPQSYIEGYFWASLAATIEPDQVLYVEIRNGFASKLAPHELSKAQIRVSQWLATNKSRPRKRH